MVGARSCLARFTGWWLVADTRTLTIRSIPDEAKTSKKGDKFWVSTDSDGVEWLVWRNDALRNAVAERVDKPVEYVVATNESNGKTYRSIEGIPGVIEAEKRQGGGGGGFRKSDPVERASIEAQVALKAAVELVGGVERHLALDFVLDSAPRLYALIRQMSGAPAAAVGPKAGEGRSNQPSGIAQASGPSSPAAPAGCKKGGDHDLWPSGTCRKCGEAPAW